MQKYKSFVSDIGLIGMANIVNNLKSFIVIPLLTKSLGAFDYGIWTQMKIAVILLVPFLTFGAGQAIVKFLSGEDDKGKIREDFFSCFFMTIAASSILAALCFAFASNISQCVFGRMDYIVLVRVLAALLVSESVNLLLLDYFKAFRYIKIYFYTLLAETVIEFGLIAYAVFSGYGIIGAAVSVLFTRILFVLVRTFQVSRKVGFALPTFSNFRKYVIFGMPLVVSSSLFFVLNWSNRYFINYFLGLSEVGRYSVAYFLAYIITFIATPIGYILFPTLANSVRRSEAKEATVYLKYSFKYFLVAGIPLVLGMSFLSKEILLLFSTADFLPVRSYLPVLLVGIFVFQVGVIGEYVNIIFNRNMVIMRVYFVLAVVNTILNLVLIPTFGAMGAALALLLSFGGYAGFNLIYCQRFIRFGLEMLTALKIISASLVMLVSLYLFKKSFESINVLFFSPVSATVYFATLYFMGVFTDNEVALVKSIFANRMVPLNEKV